MLSRWCGAGLPPEDFWEQVPATYAAAMRGALEARSDRFEAERNLALINAYVGAQLSRADWDKMPPLDRWIKRMTEPPRTSSNTEIIAYFEALAQSGFDVTSH